MFGAVINQHTQQLKLRLSCLPRMFQMSCSSHERERGRERERETEVVAFGGNKQRQNKFDRNVMTDLIIFRFGKRTTSQYD